MYTHVDLQKDGTVFTVAHYNRIARVATLILVVRFSRYAFLMRIYYLIDIFLFSKVLNISLILGLTNNLHRFKVLKDLIRVFYGKLENARQTWNEMCCLYFKLKIVLENKNLT